MNPNQPITSHNPENEAAAGPLARSVEEHLNSFRRIVEGMSPEERKRRADHARALADADRQHRIRELRQKSGAPSRHLETKADFDNAWGSKFRDLHPRLGTGTILALAGSENTGKTQMAIEFLRKVTGHERRALYTTANQVFTDLKSGFTRGDRQSERDPYAKYHRPSLLIIDGMQRITATSWERNVLLEILDARFGEKRDTVLVSDSTVKELETLLGDTALTKINARGGFVACEWEPAGQ